MGSANLEWTGQDSSVLKTERDRIFECRGKNIQVPLDWMYVKPGRLKKNKALLGAILNNQREGDSFHYKRTEIWSGQWRDCRVNNHDFSNSFFCV